MSDLQPQEPSMIALAKMYAQSSVVPKHYQQSPANVLIALDYAKHMREPVLGIMRCTFVVHGTMGFKSEFLIGKANASGIFDEPIQYEDFGTPGEKDFRVRAGAPVKGKMLWGPWVTWRAVSEEGWLKNAKYQSMPELMFRYRAATFFVRQTCPQVLFGAQTVEELEDVAAAEQRQSPRDVDIEGPAALTAKIQARARATEPQPRVEREPELVEPAKAKQAKQVELLFTVCPACDGGGVGVDGGCRVCGGTGELAEEVPA